MLVALLPKKKNGQEAVAALLTPENPRNCARHSITTDLVLTTKTPGQYVLAEIVSLMRNVGQTSGRFVKKIPR